MHESVIITKKKRHGRYGVSIIDSILNSSLFAKHFTGAVVLAAGVGSRFSSDGTKQNFPICGIPCVVRTLMAFEDADIIGEVVLVGREEELGTLREYVENYGLKKVTKIVCGGATRDESARRGYYELDKRAKYVAVHDGARCLVTPEIIEKTVRAAFRYGAAAAAEKAVDTVKVADDGGFISSTVDRDRVWLVKTPQVFKSAMYLTATECAKKDGVKVTDDCMMAERLGFSVKLVDCGHENIKLTDRSDADLAEHIIKKRLAKGEKTE